ERGRDLALHHAPGSQVLVTPGPVRPGAIHGRRHPAVRVFPLRGWTAGVHRATPRDDRVAADRGDGGSAVGAATARCTPGGPRSAVRPAPAGRPAHVRQAHRTALPAAGVNVGIEQDGWTPDPTGSEWTTNEGDRVEATAESGTADLPAPPSLADCPADRDVGWMLLGTP